jgi:hypothetical protein
MRCSDIDFDAYLLGEGGRDSWSATTRHLYECDDCRRELIDHVAAGVALRHLAMVETTLPAVRPMTRDHDAEDLPQLQIPTQATPAHPMSESAADRRGVGRRVWALVAAVALLVGGLGWWAGQARSGAVTMHSSPGTAQMDIDLVGLPPTDTRHYYYAWLLDPTSNKMLPLGVVTAGHTSTFSLDPRLAGRYTTVDISLQADNGDPTHSQESLLRGSI